MAYNKLTLRNYETCRSGHKTWLTNWNELSEATVGQILMSIPTKVCKIPTMVMVGIFFLWFLRDFFIYQVNPKEILHLKVSLIIFKLNFNQ